VVSNVGNTGFEINQLVWAVLFAMQKAKMRCSGGTARQRIHLEQHFGFGDFVFHVPVIGVLNAPRQTGC
jgi:hypothetical protein